MTFQEFQENISPQERVAISCKLREFPLRYSYGGAFKLLTDIERGKMIEAALNYCFEGKEASFDDIYMQMMFEVIKGDINFAAYEEYEYMHINMEGE